MHLRFFVTEPKGAELYQFISPLPTECFDFSLTTKMHLHTSLLPSTSQTHSVKNPELNADHKPVVNYISGPYPYILFSLLPVVVQDGWLERYRTMAHLVKINIELLIHVKNSPSVPITFPTIGPV